MPDRPHRLACVVKMPAQLQVVTQPQLEALAVPVDTCIDTLDRCSAARPVVPPEHLAEVVKRATNYMKWRRPASEGKGGDAQTFEVICILENDFALPIEAAWPILLKWNERCDPPWDEDELERKWNYAERTAKGPRGEKLPRSIRSQLRWPPG